MELRSCVLAVVEPRDISLGAPSPSTPATEGSGELVPVGVVSSAGELAASASH